MKTVQIKKGEILQRSGDLKHKVYHVRSGLLRSYYIDNSGKEHIFMFAPERAELYIDAIENSVLEVFDKIIKEEEKNIGKFITRLTVLQTRVIMLLSTSAIDRYNHFLSTYPDIVQRVPQRMIASYLGVNPETLSAAKSQSFRKKTLSAT